MKEVLNTMVQALVDQAIALGTLGDRVTALKQTLARQFPDLADDLKAQIETEQEKSRNDIYELQVSLARVREAISHLPEAASKVEPPKAERKRKPSRAPAAAAR